MELETFPQLQLETPTGMAVLDKECVTSLRYGQYVPLFVCMCVRTCVRTHKACACMPANVFIFSHPTYIILWLQYGECTLILQHLRTHNREYRASAIACKCGLRIQSQLTVQQFDMMTKRF